MTRRSIFSCTIVGAIVLLAYQSLSHAAVPWDQLTTNPLADAPAVDGRAVSEPSIGAVYFNAYGVFMATAMAADVADSTTIMGPMMIRQLALNVAVVFLLCLLAGRLSSRKPAEVATASALAGLAAAAALSVSEANWYGFTMQYAIVNTIDTAVGFFVTGFAIGALSQHLDVAARSARTLVTDYADRPTAVPVG